MKLAAGVIAQKSKCVNCCCLGHVKTNQFTPQPIFQFELALSDLKIHHYDNTGVNLS